MKYLLFAAIFLLAATKSSIAAPEVPNALLDDEHFREELAINYLTAPSIGKIFSDLESISPIPAEIANRQRPEKMPMDRIDLSLELGFLIADGFVLVQTGQTKNLRAFAQDLSRYAKALGAGDKVGRHAATLLEAAEKGDLNRLKKELVKTQRDVESELVTLRDPDLAHLISLGGWIRALQVATQTLDQKFSEEKAQVLFRDEIPQYFGEALQGLHPQVVARSDIKKMSALLAELEKQMKLPEGKKPTPEEIKQLAKTAAELSGAALSRENRTNL